MIYHRWRVVHHGTAPFQIHAPISKGRMARFRHFRRMLHLAPQMLHPVEIDSSEGHNSWLVKSYRAITNQNEGICEFYSYDGFQPSLVSFIPKKSYPNLNRVMEVFYPSFFRHVDFFCKTGSPWLVNDLPSLESGAPWYCNVSNPCTHF